MNVMYRSVTSLATEKVKKGLFLKNSGRDIIRSTARISLPVTALKTSLSSTNEFLREMVFFPLFLPTFYFSPRFTQVVILKLRCGGITDITLYTRADLIFLIKMKFIYENIPFVCWGVADSMKP